MERQFKGYMNKVDGEVLKPYQPTPGSPSYLDFACNCPPGCYEITIKKSVKSKTNQQVKTIWGLMIAQTIAQANDLGIDVSAFMKYLLAEYEPKGTGLTPDLLHELMYLICPTTSEDGRRITLSKMSTVQAANLFERFRAIVAPLGIDIPDPNPNWGNEK